MTICGSVKVRDGLILGTDSMTQIWGPDESGTPRVMKTYENALKLFQIGTRPIGVMTYGVGNIGPRSIQGLVRDFVAEYTVESDVRLVSEQLYEFFSVAFREHFGDTPRARLGFYIAGYSPDQPFPEEWEFDLPRHTEIMQVRPLDKFGASWRGIEIPFTRLYKGFDPRVLAELEDQGLPQQAIEDIVNRYEAPVNYDGMPVQDAINFVVFILRTTVGLISFQIGPPSCGGPLQIATILPELPGARFKWIKKLELAAES